MKRTSHLACVAACLLVLITGSGPALADPPLGGSRDWQGGHRGQSDRRDWNRGHDSAGRSAERRPLGTSRDDYRGGHDRSPRRDDRYRRPYEYERYGSDARRAADAVRRDERGRVLSSQPTDDRGYRVRVLTPDGYVRERYVDPREDRGDARRYRNRD